MNSSALVNEISNLLVNKGRNDLVPEIVDILKKHFETHDEVINQILEKGTFFCKRGKKQIEIQQAKARIEQGLTDTMYIMFDYSEVRYWLSNLKMND